jgi:hypothetical protein
MNSVVHHETQQEHCKPVFIKYAPLIDPIRYMTGKYKVDTEKLHVLPNPFSKEEDLPLQKIAHHNNTSYTDNFFSFLTSTLLNTHGFVHGLDYYGSFLGVQTTFKANISDDLEYLNASEYFSEQLKIHPKLTKLLEILGTQLRNCGSSREFLDKLRADPHGNLAFFACGFFANFCKSTLFFAHFCASERA